MNSTIVTYLRNNKGAPVGAIAAIAIGNDAFGIGWSKLNVSHGDVWDRERALHIATKRAIYGTGPEVTIPHDVEKEIGKMQTRAFRYFKNKKILV